MRAYHEFHRTITLTRKLFTMLLSVVVYKHQLTLGQWVGAGVVFAGISVEAFVKRKGAHNVPHKIALLPDSFHRCPREAGRAGERESQDQEFIEYLLAQCVTAMSCGSIKYMRQSYRAISQNNESNNGHMRIEVVRGDYESSIASGSPNRFAPAWIPETRMRLRSSSLWIRISVQQCSKSFDPHRISSSSSSESPLFLLDTCRWVIGYAATVLLAR